MASEKFPKPTAALDGRSAYASVPWYDWFAFIDELASSGSITADAAAEAIRQICLALGSPDGTPENIPPQGGLPVTTYVSAGNGISVSGSLASGGVVVSLNAGLDDLNDVDTSVAAPGNSLVFNGTDWVPGVVSGGVLPVVTGETPPVFVYFDDGSLLLAPASY